MLYLIPLFPVIGAAINGLWYLLTLKPHKHGDNGNQHEHHGNSAWIPGSIASVAIGSAFVVGLLHFFELLGLPEDERNISEVVFSWLQVTGLNLDIVLQFDVLSSLFVLVITGVGLLIHLYSIGYMGHDESPAKFFCYLNLFCFAMLMLVLGGSLPVLFFGWEGVGLCSYLLIGYWYKDAEKASAGKKAFIVNRIGDFGFLLAMFMIYSFWGTLSFNELTLQVADPTTQVSTVAITAICLLLFLGCTGKSAQIPLFVWLPDAMAGPTPVSALIHAATMVTSGIYLLSRLNFLFVLSPVTMTVIAWVGAITAFFAATIAVAQNDIKKVLAYSTISQLGYMFLACGVGAFGAGVFHVITHAFFKALLFLGAGSVIYCLHHEQDILKMGGLREKLPRTFFVFAVGWLAICGLPPFSGFFSKDEILWLSFSSPQGSTALWAVGMLTALMTAFYMTRLFSLTFLGKYRGESAGHGHGHAKIEEAPWIMTGPLFVLAGLSAVGGFMGIPHHSWLGHFLHPVVGHPESTKPESLEWVLMGLSVLGAAIGVFLGLRTYRELKTSANLRARHAGLYKVLSNKWYIDEIYEVLFVKTIYRASVFLWKKIDVAVVDRIVMSFAWISLSAGQTLRIVQTGSIQAYFSVILLGLLLGMGIMIYGMV